MIDFVRRRGPSLALVVLVTGAAALAQSSIAYTFAFGALKAALGFDLSKLAELGYVGRWGLLTVMAVLWLLGKKRPLFLLAIIVNGFATLVLLLHTGFLTSVLAGLSARTVREILLDVVFMGISNILIFSIWYWVIDPPGIESEPGAIKPWAFLFPQRAGELPHYGDWQPRYLDYLFLAFTTSFAFSPTDTLPLTRGAKMLMLLQAAISVITLTGIAGSAINILAGTATG
ncbi:hypothetical protein GCM10027034_16780 [Ramlibacter solisilvae]|uniref:hypothetical protein n=1 Tax=Ramlibacter tataouinensis TaxID=94132 RepID=UPI000777DF87|nr:hypothetical protein [Ramlibacter tataouinensis]